MHKFKKISKKIVIISFFVGMGLFLLFIVGTYAFFIQDISTKERLMNKADTGLVLLDDTGRPFFYFL